MARGPSGRVVLEIGPELKRELHSRLAGEGKTLKEWFLVHVNVYLHDQEPLQLPLQLQRKSPPRKARPKRSLGKRR